MADLTPEQVASREFRTAFRGYDPEEVRAFLVTLSKGLGELLDERPAAVAVPDLGAEIEAVIREIGTVLQTAREAAEAMRERAASESARWRSEALAEARELHRAAEEDAVALRSDAWTTSEQLLHQVQTEVARIREHADADSLRIVGEAEREAHRLGANSRREADETLRTARMEAEQLVVRARSEHDEIIASALRQAEAAQERTRALEERRQELMRELEMVRSALGEVEGELDQRRERLGLSQEPAAEPRPTVADGPAPESAESDPDQEPGTWEPGETVRVVKRNLHPETGEVVRPDTQPDVKVVSAAEMARRHDPSAAIEPAEGGEDGPTGAPLDVEGDEPLGTMVRPAGAASEPDRPEESERTGAPAPTGAGESEGDTGDLDHEPVERLDEGDAGGPVEVDEPAGMDEDDLADSEAGRSTGGDAPVEPDAPPHLRAVPDAPEDDELPASEAQQRRAGPARTQSAPRLVAASEIADREAELVGTEGPADSRRPDSAEATEHELAGARPEGAQSFEELAGLFQRLRTDDLPSGSGDRTERPARSGRVAVGPDPFELRDRLLLPIANRALRSLKRQLTEEQNVVLEEIRLDESGWTPDISSLHARVRADLVVLHAESFGAGHNGALELLGTKGPRPATPRLDVAEPFAEALAADLSDALDEGRRMGQGARQLGATLSRVFRAWRTDQAERRVREMAVAAYHDGLTRTVELAGGGGVHWVVGGRRCATCRALAEEPLENLPPAHAGCECTVAP